MPLYQTAVPDDSHYHSVATQDRPRWTLSGNERSTLASAIRQRVEEWRPDAYAGYPVGTVSIDGGNMLIQVDRMTLNGNARVSATFDGRINLYGTRPSGRLVLTGFGGGS